MIGSSSRSSNGCGFILNIARFSEISQLLASSWLSLFAVETIPLDLELWFDRTVAIKSLELISLSSPLEYSVLRSPVASLGEATTASAMLESDGAGEDEAITFLSDPLLLFFKACKMNRGVKFFAIQSAL